MKVAVLGRSQTLFGILESLLARGHQVTTVVSPPASPEHSKSSNDFRKVADSHGIPFSSDIKLAQLREFLAIGSPDVGVSANFPFVLPTEVIDSIPHGILNVHGGDLPRYRGNACQAWAIINGEERVGLCVHKMEGGKLDSGDIISRDYFPIDAFTSITSIHRWMTKTSPGLVNEALAAIEKDPTYILERQTDSQETPLRCFPRRPEDARLDWSKSATELVRLIKASSRPYRGAYCYLDEDELIVWDAVVSDFPGEFVAVPGSLISVTDDSKIVACGSGCVQLLDYSFAREQYPAPKLSSVRQRLT